MKVVDTDEPVPEVLGDDPAPVDVPVAPVPEVPAVKPVPEVPAVEPVPVESVVPTNTDAYAVVYKTYFVFASERQDFT